MFDKSPILPNPPYSQEKEGSKKSKYKKPRLHPFAKEYFFMEVEVRYGLMQVCTMYTIYKISVIT